MQFISYIESKEEGYKKSFGGRLRGGRKQSRETTGIG